MAASDELPYSAAGKVQQHSAAIVVPMTEPRCDLDDATRLEIMILAYVLKGTELRCFHWKIKFNKTIIASGNANDFTDAAEACERKYMEALTKYKLMKACEPFKGMKIALFGKWISNEEYLKYKGNLQVIIDANDDERNQEGVFVIGYPSLARDKVIVEIDKFKKSSRFGNEANLILKSGFEVSSFHDFYIFKPEERIHGEIKCVLCDTCGPIPHLGARFINGQGMHCGPCIEHLGDSNKLTDFEMDFE